eukprot:g26581.t1
MATIAASAPAIPSGNHKPQFEDPGIAGYNGKRFAIQLNIRTYASSGLVYYVAHQNQIDYAALQLWKGQLHFLFNLGKGTAMSIMPTPINDGKWHT